MNSLIKQRLFVTLANSARLVSGKPGFLKDSVNELSLKNTRRIKRYRAAKEKQEEISNLMESVEKHKQAHDKLKKAVDSLTDSVSSTIRSHDAHRMAISDVKKKLKSINSLKQDLEILKSITIEAHDHKDIDMHHFRSLILQITKISKHLEKKQIQFEEALDL